MIIKLKNGTDLDCLGIHGGKVMYQGVNRDSLTFLFAYDLDLEDLSFKFSPDNTSEITIYSEDSVDIHSYYTIRVSCGKGRKDSILSYGIESPDMVSWVKMAQTTVQERTIQSLQDTVDMMILTSLEE